MGDIYEKTFTVERLTINLKKEERQSSGNLAEDVRNIVKDILVPHQHKHILHDIICFLNNEKIRDVIKKDDDCSGDGKDAIYWLDKINAYLDTEESSMDDLFDKLQDE